jgi:hypothetical protein
MSFVMDALSLAQSPVCGYIVFRYTAAFNNYIRIKWLMEETCFEPAGALTFYLS